MNKNIRVPIVSLVTGIILTLINSLINYIIGSNGIEITGNIINILTKTELIFSIILIFIMGLFLFKDMSRTEIFKSSIIVSIYYGSILLIENILLKNGIYISIIQILFLPVKSYASLFNFLKIMTKFNYLISMMISILSPLIYIIFAREDK